MFDSIKKVTTGLTELTEVINPLITNLTDKNKAIAVTLLDNGFTVKEIQDFVDVSRAQLDEWIQIESEVRARIAAATKKSK